MHVSTASPGCRRRWLSLLQLALRAAREEEDEEGWSDVPSLPGRRTIPQDLTEGRATHKESTFGARWLASRRGVFGGAGSDAGREGKGPLPPLGVKLNSAGAAPWCYSCGVPDLAVLPPLAPLDSASEGNLPKSKQGAAETPWEIEGAPRTLCPCYI